MSCVHPRLGRTSPWAALRDLAVLLVARASLEYVAVLLVARASLDYVARASLAYVGVT